MELELVRTYLPEATHGLVYGKGLLICRTIELPWRDNQKLRSCIPEGRYELVKRYSPRYGWHLLVKGVPNRSFILIHAANDARRELKGCIAPVSQITSPGKGLLSRNALEKLKAVVYKALEKGPVFLTIKTS
jgi:hypothetical protein